MKSRRSCAAADARADEPRVRSTVIRREELKMRLEESSSETAVPYAHDAEPPPVLPSGYAALLYMYGLR